jgi:glycine cleavage system protein P-like pyridoxal-binding family
MRAGTHYTQSAMMAGLKVVPVKSLQDGNLDLVDLKEKAEKHKDNLAALMVSSGQRNSFHRVIDFPRSLIHLHLASSKMVSLMYVKYFDGCIMD